MMNKTYRIIVALSGGKGSAWCANWALGNYQKEDVILYFNDTKWEHPDLYRFLKDLEDYFKHKITWDSDGRTPEELFIEHHALANNRMPFCSRVLKGDRLRNYYNDGDIIIFGIGNDEVERAKSLTAQYQKHATKTNKFPILKFPLIENKISKYDIKSWLIKTGIKEPMLYSMGFNHNNCSGGCVRQGAKYWKLLLNKLPKIYAVREKTEETFNNTFNKHKHFMKKYTLKEFRLMIENQKDFFEEDVEESDFECMGICDYTA